MLNRNQHHIQKPNYKWEFPHLYIRTICMSLYIYKDICVHIYIRTFVYKDYKDYPSSSCTAHSHIPIFHTMSTSKEWLSAVALETEACDCSEFLNTTSPRVRMHRSSQKQYAVQDMRQMIKEFSNSSVYFLQVQVALPFLQWGGFPLLFYCRVGWIKLDSAKWQKHNLLMMKDAYRPHMLVQSFCSWKFIAVSGKLKTRYLC